MIKIRSRQISDLIFEHDHMKSHPTCIKSLLHDHITRKTTPGLTYNLMYNPTYVITRLTFFLECLSKFLFTFS